MSILVASILGLLALAFVLYPLYRPAFARTVVSSPQQEATHGSESPSEREQAARTALQEVEFDFQLGNISESDYGVLRERYMRRALVALKVRYDREQELDALIEAQLQQMREEEKDGK